MPVRGLPRHRHLALSTHEAGELQEEGGPDSGKTLDSVLEDLKVRDQRDQERASSPLRAAEDAVTLDTSKLSVSEAAEAAIDAVRKTRASHR